MRDNSLLVLYFILKGPAKPFILELSFYFFYIFKSFLFFMLLDPSNFLNKWIKAKFCLKDLHKFEILHSIDDKTKLS